MALTHPRTGEMPATPRQQEAPGRPATRTGRRGRGRRPRLSNPEAQGPAEVTSAEKRVRHPRPGGVLRRPPAGASGAGRPRSTRSATTTRSRRCHGCRSAATGSSRLAGSRFRSHFGFDAFYCHPGVEGAHQKGAVEGEGGRFRRTHCVPMPVVDSIAELNELLAKADATDDYCRIGNRVQTVGHDGQLERTSLRPCRLSRSRPG